MVKSHTLTGSLCGGRSARVLSSGQVVSSGLGRRQLRQVSVVMNGKGLVRTHPLRLGVIDWGPPHFRKTVISHEDTPLPVPHVPHALAVLEKILVNSAPAWLGISNTKNRYCESSAADLFRADAGNKGANSVVRGFDVRLMKYVFSSTTFAPRRRADQKSIGMVQQ